MKTKLFVNMAEGLMKRIQYPDEITKILTLFKDKEQPVLQGWEVRCGHLSLHVRHTGIGAFASTAQKQRLGGRFSGNERF